MWLIVFASGLHDLLGVSIIPPYRTYTPYQEYILPGLIGMIVLFQSMQSALSLVYDREVGVMRVMLVTPLPRPFILFAKILAATVLALLQAAIFLAIAAAFGITLPLKTLVLIVPAVILAGLMLGLDRPGRVGLHPPDRELCRHDELCDLPDVLPVFSALPLVETA